MSRDHGPSERKQATWTAHRAVQPWTSSSIWLSVPPASSARSTIATGMASAEMARLTDRNSASDVPGPRPPNQLSGRGVTDVTSRRTLREPSRRYSMSFAWWIRSCAGFPCPPTRGGHRGSRRNRQRRVPGIERTSLVFDDRDDVGRAHVHAYVDLVLRPFLVPVPDHIAHDFIERQHQAERHVGSKACGRSERLEAIDEARDFLRPVGQDEIERAGRHRISAYVRRSISAAHASSSSARRTSRSGREVRPGGGAPSPRPESSCRTRPCAS